MKLNSKVVNLTQKCIPMLFAVGTAAIEQVRGLEHFDVASCLAVVVVVVEILGRNLQNFVVVVVVGCHHY